MNCTVSRVIGVPEYIVPLWGFKVNVFGLALYTFPSCKIPLMKRLLKLFGPRPEKTEIVFPVSSEKRLDGKAAGDVKSISEVSI
jgi:hypothetical protein